MAIVLTTDDTRREVFLKAEQAKVQTGGGGTADHRELTHRSDPDQHPISAITGLQEELGGINAKIPGALSDLSEDATHRVVTDAEKAKWNEKITAPVTGEVGQIIRIKTVDYTGHPTEWEAVDAPTGGVQFTTDETLSLKDGVLSVRTAQEPEPDNTLPITSAAVHTVVGNIEIILQTI